jgi:hypothetical protein
MQKIKVEYEAAGRTDFQMVVINDASASTPSQQKKMLGKGEVATFPALQATGSVGWSSLSDCKNRKGKKNDGFIFAPDGRFIRKHEGKGTVYMNVWEDDVRGGLTTKIEDLDGCECTEVKDATKKVHRVVCK